MSSLPVALGWGPRRIPRKGAEQVRVSSLSYAYSLLSRWRSLLIEKLCQTIIPEYRRTRNTSRGSAVPLEYHKSSTRAITIHPAMANAGRPLHELLGIVSPFVRTGRDTFTDCTVDAPALYTETTHQTVWLIGRRRSVVGNTPITPGGAP